MDSYQETETRSGGENGEGDEDEIRSATHLSLSTPAMNKEDTFELFFWGEEAAFVNWLCRMPMILASLSPHPLYIFLVFPTRLCRDFTCAVSSTPLPFPISHFPNYMACRLRTWPLDLLPLSHTSRFSCFRPTPLDPLASFFDGTSTFSLFIFYFLKN